MIRYHSCYPWHTGGAYRSLMNQADHDMLPWVLEFNKFDLYTKDNEASPEVNFTVDSVWPYYQALIEKYFPADALAW